jgi:hypothetical protein
MSSHHDDHEKSEYMVYADVAKLRRSVDRLVAQIEVVPRDTQFPEWWKSKLTLVAAKAAMLDDSLASYAEGVFGRPYGMTHGDEDDEGDSGAAGYAMSYCRGVGRYRRG